MPAFKFQQVVKMTEQEFGMEFKSLSDLHSQEDALSWLREQSQLLRKTNPGQLLQMSGKTKRLLPGRMYMMRYLPANKNTLPYYDIFPVFFCMNVYDDYFSGLNMHYLPPIYRAELMDTLYPFVIGASAEGEQMAMTLRTKIQPKVDYEFMKRRRTMMSFKPMWKRYRFKNVVGQFLYIPPIAWDTVMMLPVARFRKASINRVWRESLITRRKYL